MVKKNNVGSEKWTYAEFEKFLQTFPDGSMENWHLKCCIGQVCEQENL